jgi:hypothetical protein
MMLIEADARGEWKVRADAHEHPSPVPVVDVKVVSAVRFNEGDFAK